jgi:hypothetical protein
MRGGVCPHGATPRASSAARPGRAPVNAGPASAFALHPLRRAAHGCVPRHGRFALPRPAVRRPAATAAGVITGGDLDHLAGEPRAGRDGAPR